MSETIEQKTLRIISTVLGDEITVAELEFEPLTMKVHQEIVELAIAEEREACGWQDISTAPKDGTLIDVWVGGKKGRVCDVAWEDGCWVTEFEYGLKRVSYWMHGPKHPKEASK